MQSLEEKYKENHVIRMTYIFCLVFPMFIDIGFGWRHFSSIMDGYLSDPDSYMRLLRIRQGIDHGTLLNYVMRDDSGHPLIIEWSRLYDAVILFLASPLTVFMPVMTAVKTAGILATPLWSGLTAVAIAYGVQPFCKNKSALVFAGICIGLMPGIFRINAFGTIQYHMFLACVMTWAIAFAGRVIYNQNNNEDVTIMSLASGLVGGLAIWAMPETWPFILCSYAALVWLDEPTKKSLIPLKWTTGFLIATSIGAIIDPPSVFIEYDRISIVYVWLSLLLFMGAFLRSLIVPVFHNFIEKLVLFVIPMIFCLIWFVVWPNIIKGPWGLTTPQDFKLFFGSAVETLPPSNFWMGLSLAGPGIWAAIYCLWLVVQAAKKHNWNTMGAASIGWIACLFAAGLTLRFQLFSAFSSIAGAAIIPLLISYGIDKGDNLKGALTRISYGLLGVVPFLALFPMAAQGHAHKAKIDFPIKQCRLTKGAAHLIDIAGRSIVLAPIDRVPAILYNTETTGVGSIYQHGISHYVEAVKAWQSKSMTGAVPESVIKTKAKYIAFCADVPPPGATPKTLWANLAHGKVPTWLTEVGTSGNWSLYRIKNFKSE